MRNPFVDDLVQAGCERGRAEFIHAAINSFKRQYQHHRPEDVRAWLSQALLSPAVDRQGALWGLSPNDIVAFHAYRRGDIFRNTYFSLLTIILSMYSYCMLSLMSGTFIAR